jgi:hypothetical protein
LDATISIAAVTDWVVVVPDQAGIAALPITRLEITAATLVFKIFIITPLTLLGDIQIRLASNLTYPSYSTAVRESYKDESRGSQVRKKRWGKPSLGIPPDRLHPFFEPCSRSVKLL